MKTVSNCKQRSNDYNKKISAGLREEIARSRNKYEELKCTQRQDQPLNKL